MDDSRKEKRIWLCDLLVIVGGLLGIGGALVVIRMLPLLIIWIAFAMIPPGDDLLLTTTSPQGIYTLEVHQINPCATEPFTVRVLRTDGGRNELVYQVRGQEDAEIIWLSDTVAEINGVPVDVTSGECFKANARGYFDVMVQVKADDVSWLEMTVCMDGEPRVTRSRTGMLLSDPADAWGLSPRLNVLKELHWDDDLSKKKAGLTVKLRTDNGQEIALPYMWEWTADVYGDYAFTLTGSAAWGYTLTPDDVECSVTRMEDAHE